MWPVSKLTMAGHHSVMLSHWLQLITVPKTNQSYPLSRAKLSKVEHCVLVSDWLQVTTVSKVNQSYPLGRT